MVIPNSDRPTANQLLNAALSGRDAKAIYGVLIYKVARGYIFMNLLKPEDSPVIFGEGEKEEQAMSECVANLLLENILLSQAVESLGTEVTIE